MRAFSIRGHIWLIALIAACFSVTLVSSLSAQSAEKFYENKHISFIVGYNPGGSYDTYARLAAEHLSRHIPGRPSIVVQNMQGAGGLNAGSYLATKGPRDGTTIGMIGQATALEQVLGNPAARLDAGKLSWIGRITSAIEATIVWHTSPTKTIQDARRRETVLSAAGPLSTAATNPLLMNNLAGTKFKIITGYAGSAATLMAMEKGETEGAYIGLATLLSSKSDWLRDKKISVLVQYSQKRHRAFPDVPAMAEFGDTPEERQILALYSSTAEIGISIMAPPEIPGERLDVLRSAFDATMADPAFLATAASRHMEVEPLTGAELHKLIASALATPRNIAKLAADARRHK